MDFPRIKQLSEDIKRENGASLATRAVHADADVDGHSAIAPALHTSTTYRFADEPNDLVAFKDLQVKQKWPFTFLFRSLTRSTAGRGPRLPCLRSLYQSQHGPL